MELHRAQILEVPANAGTQCLLTDAVPTTEACSRIPESAGTPHWPAELLFRLITGTASSIAYPIRAGSEHCLEAGTLTARLAGAGAGAVALGLADADAGAAGDAGGLAGPDAVAAAVDIVSRSRSVRGSVGRRTDGHRRHRCQVR